MPVAVGLGEGVEDLKEFDKDTYLASITQGLYVMDKIEHYNNLLDLRQFTNRKTKTDLHICILEDYSLSEIAELL